MATARRLTEFSHGGGCACKLDPGLLDQVLSHLPRVGNPNLLVGIATGDDAAVWKVSEGRALVATTDFLTPLVDDPNAWGRIAATNAVSDIYAMGGKPLFGLNIASWPTDELPLSTLSEVLIGGAEAARTCGFVVTGGHSISGNEPKYGMVVIGEIATENVLTNSGLQPDDALILTKPLGVGIICTAIKKGRAPISAVDAAIATMTQHNGAASQIAVQVGASACTDVTGFGLIGHLHKMARASGVDIEIDVSSVPSVEGARDLAGEGITSSGAVRNRDWINPSLVDADNFTQIDLGILNDPQTSGGLAIGVAHRRLETTLRLLKAQSIDGKVIGRAISGTGQIVLR